MIPISKPIITQDEIDAVCDVLKTGMLAQGAKAKKLEEFTADYCNINHAVAMSSGTAAIHAGLYALDISDGDEVITTPFTFVATANPILMQRAKVVFADIDEEDFNISPQSVEKKITKKTKAVIPVDLYGQIYNFQAITSLAKRYNLKILEDACQSIGAEQNGKKAGNFGNIAAFSFYSTKNIMCGEGGMLVTNDAYLAEKARQFRHHGQSEQTRYEYRDIGYNYRTTDICAAIALEQFKKLDNFSEKRRRNAQMLTYGLQDIKGLMLPKEKNGNKHIFHQYTVRITKDFRGTRDELIEYLRDNDIGCAVYYPKPLHLHQHFQKVGYKEGDFPIAEKISKEVLSLPVHPMVTSEEIKQIVQAIRNYGK